ncbi:hypothetical protein HY214_01720 [Candidatus Roizmanbacteria bacterium]|nr:hypothetical protein [Candidatus Roizmanbacteria bacterium]
MLKTVEAARINFFQRLQSETKQKLYRRLSTPSMKNLFKVFDILFIIGAAEYFSDNQGNVIEVSQEFFEKRDAVTGQWIRTREVRLAIRQKLPTKNREGEEEFLSIIMSKKQRAGIDIDTNQPVETPEKGISIYTSIARQTSTMAEEIEYGSFKSIIPLRTDTIDVNGKFIERTSYPGHNRLEIFDGQRLTEVQILDKYLNRAYLILVKQLFRVAEVPPLGSNQHRMGLG